MCVLGAPIWFSCPDFGERVCVWIFPFEVGVRHKDRSREQNNRHEYRRVARLENFKCEGKKEDTGCEVGDVCIVVQYV